jgi:beta-galactosidase
MHRGGFTAFSFDLTNHLKSADNQLVVSVDNRSCIDPSAAASSFNQYGGIYRQVFLVAVDAPHVSLTDHGTSGVYVTQGTVSEAAAAMSCAVKLRHYELGAVATTVAVAIQDARGQEVAAADVTVPCPQDAETTATIPFTIPKPHLWQGRKDPHLYTATIRVSSRGRLTDTVTQRFGIRTFSVDGERGSHLNGSRYDLHGVSLHQDRQGKGWLVSRQDLVEDVNVIKDMGATFVRLVHYPHHPDMYDLLDEAGIVVWSEIPCAGIFTMTQAQKDDAKSQLKEMIRQHYNHPGIAVWGIYNQIPSGDEHRKLVQDLVRIAHAEDATRPVVGASVSNDNDPMHHDTDLIGMNRYFGWFFPSISRMKPWAEDFHKQYPKLLFGLGEYGAGGSPRKHAEQCFEPLFNFRALPGIPHPEEYQAMFHEKMWGQIGALDYLWCKTIWEMFDHESQKCMDGDELHVCDMGLVTRDRSIRKDAYYFYQASWSDKPMIHITSRRFNPRTAAFISVKAYTNLPQVDATLNGQPLPRPERSGCVVTWRNVGLRSGANAVSISGQRNGQHYRDEVQWTLIPEPGLQGVAPAP